ncbi:MAG TPA: hypothetical protein VF718_00270 [Allosphingosinicella sp.]
MAGLDYLDEFGRTEGAFEMSLVLDSHLEAAGRVRMLATSLFATVVGLSALLYFAWTVRLFEPRSRWWAIGAYVAVAAVGLSLVWAERGGNSQKMMTRPVLCAPLVLVDTGNPGARATLRVWPDGRPEGESDDGFERRCAASATFGKFKRINDRHRFLLPLILPAVVLGAISCLGKRTGGREARGEAVERLKIWLYLTAAMFVAGLLLMSALLQWPAFAYQGAAKEAFRAHVSAYVLYLGVLYTLFIAAFYMPIYVRLAAAHRRSARAEGSDAAEPINPLDLGKIMLGIFAPAIAGLLGDVLQF